MYHQTSRDGARYNAMGLEAGGGARILPIMRTGGFADGGSSPTSRADFHCRFSLPSNFTWSTHPPPESDGSTESRGKSKRSTGVGVSNGLKG